MKKSLVSVIIPVYNIENYVGECVDSVLCQTYSDLEILLIDDGSTDASGKICEGYRQRDDRIRVIHQQNQGLGRARNTGIEKSNGEYILFIDGDDVVRNDCVEVLLRLCEMHPGCIAAGQALYYEDGEKCGFSKAGDSKTGCLKVREALLRYMRQHPMMETAAWARLIPAELFWKTEIRFPASCYEDLATMYRLYRMSAGIAYTEKKIYGYRQRKTGIMLGSFKPEKGEDILRVTEQLTADFRNDDEEMRRAVRSRCFSALSNVYMTIPDGEYADIAERIWNQMRLYRRGLVWGSGVRPKARFGAMASLTGRKGMRMIYRMMK